MINGFVLRRIKKNGCDECDVKMLCRSLIVPKKLFETIKIICTRHKKIIYLPLSKLKKERFWKMELKRIKKEIISCKKCFFKGQGYKKCVGKKGKMLCAVNGELYYLALVIKKF